MDTRDVNLATAPSSELRGPRCNRSLKISVSPKKWSLERSYHRCLVKKIHRQVWSELVPSQDTKGFIEAESQRAMLDDDHNSTGYGCRPKRKSMNQDRIYEE